MTTIRWKMWVLHWERLSGLHWERKKVSPAILVLVAENVPGIIVQRQNILFVQLNGEVQKVLFEPVALLFAQFNVLVVGESRVLHVLRNKIASVEKPFFLCLNICNWKGGAHSTSQYAQSIVVGTVRLASSEERVNYPVCKIRHLIALYDECTITNINLLHNVTAVAKCAQRLVASFGYFSYSLFQMYIFGVYVYFHRLRAFSLQNYRIAVYD